MSEITSIKRKASSDSLDRKISKIIKKEKAQSPIDVNLSCQHEPLTQDDVIYFQKEAIYRMFHIQYKKNKRLLSSLSDINNKYSQSLIYNSILIQWWFQIIDNIKLLFDLSDDQLSSITDLNDDILISLKSLETFDDKDDDLSIKLNKLHENLTKLLNWIFKSNNDNNDNNDNNNNNNNNMSSSSMDKILSLENQISKLSTLNNSLDNENSNLKSSILDLNDKLDDEIRQNDRLNSKSLIRIKDGEEKSDSNSNLNSDANSIDHSNKIIKTEISNNDNSDNNTTDNTNDNKDNNDNSNNKTNTIDSNNSSKSAVEDLKLKISSIEGKNESLQSQLDGKIKKISDLEKLISDLEFKLNNLNDDELLKISSNYRNLIEENKELMVSLDEIKFNKKKIENQLFELESKFSINKSKLETKFKTELDNNNNHISKLENDINRIRSDRDSLNSKISILQNEKGKNELIDNFKILVDNLQKRISELENFQNLNLEKLSTDDHNKILVNELKQLEQAFKSIREISTSKLLKSVDSEILVNKLSVEKSKADEKYFQAMRVKDSLSSQNKILSSNLSKQMELIEILKSNESELVKKLSIEEKIYENLSKIESLYQNNILKLNNKISNLEKTVSNKSETEKDLLSQISKGKLEIQQLDKKLLTCQQDLNSEYKKSCNYKSLVESYRNGNVSETKTTGNDSEIQEALLSMTKCSLCAKNFKNVALKTCGHCFCKDCVDDRLSSRMRKCPNCNSQFSRYDLLTIHL